MSPREGKIKPVKCLEHDMFYLGTCWRCEQGQGPVYDELSKLLHSRGVAILYLTDHLLPREDWASVMEAAANLREIDTEMEVLQRYKGAIHGRSKQGDGDR